MSQYLQHVDTSGDGGGTRTPDLQFRKPFPVLKFYLILTLKHQWPCGFAGFIEGNAICLCFKQFYSDLLGFTSLIGESMGKTARLIGVSYRSLIKVYLNGSFISKLKFSGASYG